MTPLARAAQDVSSGSRRSRAWLWLGAAGLSAAASVPILLADSPTPSTITAPQLQVAEARCDLSAAAAEARALRAEASALAKLARYAFAPGDGLAALDALEEAERCFARAANEAGRERVAARRRTWGARVERDYRDHLTRYQRALAAGRPLLAASDISFLLELLARQNTPFVAQLRGMERELYANPSAEGAEARR